MVATSSPSASLPSKSRRRSASVSLSWHGVSQPPTSWPLESATAASLACWTACSKRMLLGRAGGRRDSELPESWEAAWTCCAAASAASSILRKAFLRVSLASSSTREMFRAFSSRPSARQSSARASSGESWSHFLASCSRVPAIRARFPQKPLAAARGVGPRRAQAEIGCCAVTTTNSSSSVPPPPPAPGPAAGRGGRGTAAEELALAVVPPVEGALAALPLSRTEGAPPPAPPPPGSSTSVSATAAAPPQPAPGCSDGSGGHGEAAAPADCETNKVGTTSSGRMQALASEAEGPVAGTGSSVSTASPPLPGPLPPPPMAWARGRRPLPSNASQASSKCGLAALGRGLRRSPRGLASGDRPPVGDATRGEAAPPVAQGSSSHGMHHSRGSARGPPSLP
mmetsp:Transcript_57904/g.181890  ORF Transcript_57904/g.181890 Transcript_57904/m.181890 type:complete len:398 (+) Transcript_57904:352-1545(+)